MDTRFVRTCHVATVIVRLHHNRNTGNLATALLDSTRVLRKVLLCRSTYYELVPVGDFAGAAIERGAKIEKSKAQAQADTRPSRY